MEPMLFRVWGFPVTLTQTIYLGELLALVLTLVATFRYVRRTTDLVGVAAGQLRVAGEQSRIAGGQYQVLSEQATIATRQLELTLRQHEAALRPEIAIHVEIGNTELQTVYLVVQNIGAGAARDIRLEVESYFGGPHEDVRRLAVYGAQIVQNGYSYLAPAQRLDFYLGRLLGADARIAWENCAVSAKYRGTDSREYTDRFQISFSEIRTIRGSSLERIASDLNRIALRLETWAAAGPSGVRGP